MKKVMLIVLLVIVNCSFAYAGGDKVRGEKGKGSVNTGSTGQGKVSQSRAGR